MNDLFPALQESIAGRLRRQGALTGVPVLTAQESSLDNRLERSLAAASGLSVTVAVPYPAATDTTLSVASFPVLWQKILLREDLLTNSTGLSALAVAERITRWLTGWLPPVAGVTAILRPREEFPWSLRESALAEGRVEIELTFTTQITLPA